LQVNNQSDLQQGHGYEESETGLSLGSRVYNHENSLGLSGIKWVLEFVIEMYSLSCI
jgi:hypothetical protein